MGLVVRSWQEGEKETLKLGNFPKYTGDKVAVTAPAIQPVQKHTSRPALQTSSVRDTRANARVKERRLVRTLPTPLFPLPPPLPPSTSVRHLFPRFLFPRAFREQGASFQRRCFAFTFLPSNNRPVSQRTYSLPVQAFCLPFLVHSSTERFIFVAPTSSIRSLSVVVPFSFLRTP
mgnify:CR=1 FL=1